MNNKKTELNSTLKSMTDVLQHSISSTSKHQKVHAKKNLFNNSQLYRKILDLFTNFIYTILKLFIKLLKFICSLIQIGSPIKQQNMDISPSYKNINLEFSSDFSLLSQGNELQCNFSVKIIIIFFYI